MHVSEVAPELRPPEAIRKGFSEGGTDDPAHVPSATDFRAAWADADDCIRANHAARCIRLGLLIHDPVKVIVNMQLNRMMSASGIVKLRACSFDDAAAVISVFGTPYTKDRASSGVRANQGLKYL